MQIDFLLGVMTMCGRFCVDESMETKIWDVVRESDRKSRVLVVGEIKPSNTSLIIKDSRHVLDVEAMTWGFHKPTGSGLIINARSESVTDKPMFRDSILQRRCVIPASWFYEWNRQKEKVTFKREDSSILFMAGFYQKYEEGNRFVILTTAANESMRPVHDRMPVILEEHELKDWICDFEFMREALRRVPRKLCREQEYEQQSFLF